jgi:hypothetical protein
VNKNKTVKPKRRSRVTYAAIARISDGRYDVSCYTSNSRLSPQRWSFQSIAVALTAIREAFGK